MNNNIPQFFERLWPNTISGHLVKALLVAGFGYLIASRAIDSGSLWQYALAFLCIGVAINNVFIAGSKLLKKRKM